MRRGRVSGVRAMQIASALVMSVPGWAQDDVPDLDFLEYLGRWEEEDESWYVEVLIEDTEEDEPQVEDRTPKDLRAEHDDD